jgi:TPR repeat protein
VVRLFTRACDRRDGSACLALARLYEEGTGVDKSDARATSLLGRACDVGSAEGCERIAARYDVDRATHVETELAAELFARACAGGRDEACFRAARLFEGRGRSSSRTSTSFTLRSSSDLRDDARAAALYARACDGGHAQACEDLALMCEGDRGVPRDRARAASLQQKACDGGIAVACRELAERYAVGAGVAEDAARARALFGRACDAADADACFALGEICERGVGGPRDFAVAAASFERACASHAPACGSAARLYDEGLGVAVDHARADTLFAQSCGEGTLRVRGRVVTCGRRVRAPQMREGSTEVSGRLSPEITLVLWRAQYSRFHACFVERNVSGARRGSMSVRLVIDRTGAVSVLQTERTDIADIEIVRCLERAIKDVRFPPTDGGIITITDTIDFDLDEEG